MRLIRRLRTFVSKHDLFDSSSLSLAPRKESQLQAKSHRHHSSEIPDEWITIERLADKESNKDGKGLKWLVKWVNQTYDTISWEYASVVSFSICSLIDS